jgi:hypothetical protein
VAVLTGAVGAGVQISAVNVMAMDYGDGAAPNPAGQMGTFAIDAAAATDAQVASVMGISDDAACKHLAWLSMWSAGRDQECPGGAQPSAEPTCSSIVQSPDAFMTALGTF